MIEMNTIIPKHNFNFYKELDQQFTQFDSVQFNTTAKRKRQEPHTLTN